MVSDRPNFLSPSGNPKRKNHERTWVSKKTLKLHISVPRNDGCCRQSRKSLQQHPSRAAGVGSSSGLLRLALLALEVCIHVSTITRHPGSRSYSWGPETLLLSTGCPFTSFVTIQNAKWEQERHGDFWRELCITVNQIHCFNSTLVPSETLTCQKWLRAHWCAGKQCQNSRRYKSIELNQKLSSQ